MTKPTRVSRDQVVRTGAWLYVLPRLLKAAVLFVAVAIAAFLVIIPLLEELLRQMAG